jgi:predicted nucleotidyltransferase
MVDAAVLKGVENYLQSLTNAGVKISFGVIFGSYASGTADQLSDIDLLVVSPQFDGVISREDVKKLWRIAARTDSRIEPIPCGKIQWKNDVSNVIIEIARTEGQTVTAA